MPASLEGGIAQNNEVLYDDEHWTFYLASLENQPAGIGVLFMKDSVAMLAAALPQSRNQGIHHALIHKRIDQAQSLHSKLIVGQARFGSVSQNNMEREGLKIAYTKAIWVGK